MDLISLNKGGKGSAEMHKTIKNVYRDSSEDDDERDCGKHVIRSDLDKSGKNALLAITNEERLMITDGGQIGQDEGI